MPLPWDHNAWYHPYVLRRLPRRAERVLDLGCGAGLLATRLAERTRQVDAVDADPAILELARKTAPANVTYTTADALDWLSTHPSTYDAIVSVSVLHHLLLAEALRAMAAALRPGGVLIALTHTRRDLPHELPRELVATAMHHGLGLALVLRDRVRGTRHPLRNLDVQLRVANPTLAARETRRIGTEILPGVAMRPLVLWRYAVTWRKTAASESLG